MWFKKLICLVFLPMASMAVGLVDNLEHAEFQLKQSLLCEKDIQPQQVENLLKALGAWPVVQSSSLARSEYLFPYPILILGLPVTHVSIQKDMAAKGRKHTVTYQSFIRGWHAQKVAHFADMAPLLEEATIYNKKIDKKQLLIYNDGPRCTQILCKHKVTKF